MLLTKKAYDFSKSRLNDLEKQREESIQLLQKYRAEGDLSENADYIQEKQKLENAELEMAQIKGLIHNADILEKENDTHFSEIQIGSTFKMTIIRQGNFFNKADSWEYTSGKQIYKYDRLTNTTLVTGIFSFGGPTDICAEEGILSTESPLGRLLIGKVMNSNSLKITNDGQEIIIERVNS